MLYNLFSKLIRLPYAFQVDEATDRIHVDDRSQIRAQIVELMLNSPESIQKQVKIFLRDSLQP